MPRARLSAGVAALLVLLGGCAAPEGLVLDTRDVALLDDLERAGVLFFWENGHPATGLVKDRTRTDGPDDRRVASIAATGFGLTALCIADERGYLASGAVRERVRTTLRHLWAGLPNEHGFYFHFVDWATGERVWKCELSSIDTGLLLCGVISAGEHFVDDEIRDLARRIFERVDWQWMLNGGPTLSHGWRPETGFLTSRWDHYCELMLIYLLAIGSPTHPIPPAAWEAWARPWYSHFGVEYLGSPAPLFVHQFAHAWFDFRGRRDAHADYFENSVRATRAHLAFCLSLANRFPDYSLDLWGITASDGPRGYTVWGGPPEQGDLDGTVVPCAPAGSLPFLPDECLRALRAARERFGGKIWKRYGFADAFHPATGWVADDVIGIDVGISVLMAENLRTGLVWRNFARSPVVQRGLDLAGLRRR